MMSSLVVVLFSGWNWDIETVFLWRQGKSGVGRDRARRVVGAIEVQHHGSVGHGTGLQEAAAGVGVDFAGGIAEDEEQLSGGVATELCESQFLTVDLEHRCSC